MDRRRKGDGQGEELGLGCPGTSFSTLSVLHTVLHCRMQNMSYIFGRQPTQVFSRPCRRTQSVFALRRNFWLERLTEEKQCRDYETRPPGREYSLNWTLTVQTCCLEPVLNTRAQACSEAFWRPRESHSMTSWCLGRSLHCLSCRWKGRSLNCPETQWRKVGDRQGESAAIRKKSSYPSDWQTALKRDCARLQPTVWEYFVNLL